MGYLMIIEPCCKKTCLRGFQPVCTTTDDGLSLEISDLGSRGIALCSEYKDADQLRNHAAELHLCFFRICK